MALRTVRLVLEFDEGTTEYLLDPVGFEVVERRTEWIDIYPKSQDPSAERGPHHHLRVSSSVLSCRVVEPHRAPRKPQLGQG
jgi:hypothetical protein